MIQSLQHEELYSIQEYLVSLRPSVYEDQAGTAAQERAKLQAEQWIEEVHHAIGGTLEEIAPGDYQRMWIFTCQQGSCHIGLRWDYRGYDGRYFRSTDITLTSSDLALLDRLIEAGRLPYWLFQWSLAQNLDVAKLATQIFKQTGTGPESSANMDGRMQGVNYHICDDRDMPVRVTFSSESAQSPAKACLVYDGFPSVGFYHAVICHCSCPHRTEYGSCPIRGLSACLLHLRRESNHALL